MAIKPGSNVNLTDYTTVRPKSEYIIFSDFVGQDISPFVATNTGTGTAAKSSALYDKDHPGAVQLSISATNDAAAMLSPEFAPGTAFDFRTVVNIVDLATVAQDYTLFFGTMNTANASDPTNGVYFKYKRSVNTDWLACTMASTTETATDTNVAVVEDAYVELRIVINSARTSVQYFINGTLVATNTNNIPGAADFAFVGAKAVKNNGATNRLFYIDYLFFKASASR